MNNEKLLIKTIEVIGLFEVFNKENFQDMYNGLNINEVHTIDFIGNVINPKLTDIAKFLSITRGGATKITKRLINSGYIRDYKLPENKKEKYFNLTDVGKDIYKKHKSIHEQSVKRDSKMFSKLNADEKIAVFKFLDILESDLKSKIQNK